MTTPAAHPPPSKRNIRRVNEILIETYSKREASARDPLDGLILIILSQATNDQNCERAFISLRAKFPTWEDVLNAPVEKIADAIRSGGLANQKAARIRQLLREIKEDSGALDLNWMHDAAPEKCRAYLSKFHGVGPKTVACVLLFFLDKPAFPVDTHVLRIATRLGWLRAQASADEAHRILEVAVPDDCKLDLHINLIAHGRALCRADGNGGPQCGACPIKQLCAHGKSLKNAARGETLKREGKEWDAINFFPPLKQD